VTRLPGPTRTLTLSEDMQWAIQAGETAQIVAAVSKAVARELGRAALTELLAGRLLGAQRLQAGGDGGPRAGPPHAASGRPMAARTAWWQPPVAIA
jgi:hypothetical protein